MKSIYLRSFVAIAALVAVCFLIVALSFVGIGRQYVIEEYRKTMERSAEEIAHTAAAVFNSESLDSWILRMNVSSVANASGNLIFVTDESGKVLCCSDKDPVCEHIGLAIPQEILRQTELGKLGTRSDLGGVFKGQRYVQASLILSPKGEIVGYVFVSNPSGNMLGAWSTFLTIAAVIAVVVFCVALGVTMIYTRHMARPLDEMAAACEKAGVNFTVHHQRRFDPDFRTAKEVYDSGTLGSPYVIKSSLFGYNGNMHDWHVYIKEGGGMLYDWGVHLIDQMLWMIPEKITSVYANVRNVINFEVDDYFHIMLRFESGLVGEIELGTYYLTDREHWFERHWFLGGDKGSAYIDGFFPEGRIVRTNGLLKNVGGQRTMTAAGPTRSFGPPPEGKLILEDLPKVNTKHEDYFTNYVKASKGEEEFLVKIPQTRRVLKLMDAIRESARTGKSIDFE